jgi:beta-lactamase class A
VAAPALPPPAIVQPGPYEASFGLVTGTVAPGTTRIVVEAGGRALADRPLAGRSFSVRVTLPRRDVRLRVVAYDARGHSAASEVGNVFGLPRSAEPGTSAGFEDPALARAVGALARAFPGTAAVYVRSLTTGAGAAWNARARFPAASTLKLAIAVAVLRAHEGKPPPGSRVDELLRAMVTHSDNGAANELERWAGGSRRVDALLDELGLEDTIMYGGYERTPQGPIPVRIESQPEFGLGKYTTARDLSSLTTDVWLAAAGKGPLAVRARGAFTPADARYLLYLLAKVDDHGKLDRFLVGASGGVAVLHKAGWLATARHDSGLVFWPGGVYVVSVLTWNGRGISSAADVLAGRVAEAAYRRFAR